MSDNLTTLISKVQAILGDDGTIFSTATCTAAIRQALSEWNMRVPQILAVTITGIAGQYEYELSDEDSDALEILDILRQGPNQNELDTSLTFDAYIEDERVFFRLRQPVSATDTLIVRYTKDQTINGLDSQIESTLPARYNQAMIDGGAYFAIYVRAVARVESINLSKDQSDNYRDLAIYFGAAFGLRMAQATKSRRSPVGEPPDKTWEDQWHGWEQ